MNAKIFFMLLSFSVFTGATFNHLINPILKGA